MKTLLIYPNAEASNILFPSGLAYIAKSIKASGRAVDAWDLNALRPGWDVIERRIRESRYDLVGIGGLIVVYDYAKRLVEMMRKHHPDTPIIVGDSLGSSVPDLVLEKMGADYVCMGEGEETIVDLLDCLEGRGDVAEVKGIAYKANGDIKFTDRRPLQPDLDKYGTPDLDLFPLGIYRRRPFHIFDRHPDMRIPIPRNQHLVIAHRGCPYLCNFCYQQFGRKLRYRTVDDLIGEIERLNTDHGIDYVNLGIDLFIASKSHTHEFCAEYVKKGLHKKVKWGSAGRTNLMDRDLLRVMKEAGCLLLGYGYESGSQRILDFIGKNATVEQMNKTVRLTREAGINFWGSFMIGQPGETRETVEETIDFINSNDLWVPNIFFATPYPGTQLYELAEKKGLITDKERFVRDLGPAFKPTVNLTDLPDEELVDLQRSAVKKVKAHYRKKNRWLYMQIKIRRRWHIDKRRKARETRALDHYKRTNFPEWF